MSDWFRSSSIAVTARRATACAAVLLGAVLGCAGQADARPAAAKKASLPAVLDSCKWDRPGRNPFTGDVVAAVDDYTDLPVDVRTRLKDRMARREYDDMVVIGRNGITGNAKYGSKIRDMHFGNNRLCRTVTRTAWTPRMQERGLVYCEGAQCVLVPTVCRNVSRISRSAVSPAHAQGGESPEGLLAAAPPGAVGSGAGPIDLTEPPVASIYDKPQGVPRGPTGATSSTGATADAPSDAPPFAAAAAPDSPVVNWPIVAAPVFGPAIGPVLTPGVSPVPTPALPTPVPEPPPWLLLIGGLGAVAVLRRWRQPKH